MTFAPNRIDTHKGEFYVNPGPILDNSPHIAGVISAEYTVDVDRSPYVVAMVTAARPDVATLATWDPRTYPALLFSLTQTFSDGTTNWNAGTDPNDTFTQIFNKLIITKIDSNYTDNTVTLTAMSAEFLLDDKVSLRFAPYAYGTVGLYQLCGSVAALVGCTVVSGVANSDTITGDLSTWQVGVSASDFLDPLLAARGLRLYAEGANQYSIARIGEHSGFGMVSTKTFDYREGMVSASRSLSNTGGGDRSSWYDGAVLAYNWTDSGGVARNAVDCYPSNGVHRRAFAANYSTPFPGAGAAKGIVERSRKRGYTISVDQVSDYSVTPGWTARLQLPDDTAPADWKITSIAWRYPEAEMTLQLQAPITVGA